MPDWTGAEEDTTAQRYRHFGEVQVRGVSPSYEALCLGVADDPEALPRLDDLPRPKRQPNLLLGARRTQTNEPGRCATLLPVLAAVSGLLALLDMGASAGLCLYPDRYAYRYATASGAHTLGDGPRLSCEVSGPVPLPTARPDVVWRAGLDLHPLDVRDDDDVRRLEALIWPEQTERFGLLRDAVSVARREPPRVVTGDLLTDLAALAADAPTDATPVVFHSAVLAYVERRGRDTFAASVRRLAADRPTVWVSNWLDG